MRPADDLPGIVNRIGFEHPPRRPGRQEVVQVGGDAILPEERAVAVPGLGGSDDLAGGVDVVRLGRNRIRQLK
jgi:hypothetical protein